MRVPARLQLKNNGIIYLKRHGGLLFTTNILVYTLLVIMWNQSEKQVVYKIDFNKEKTFGYEKQRRWIAESGDFEIWIGASSSDIRLRIPLKL